MKVMNSQNQTNLQKNQPKRMTRSLTLKMTRNLMMRNLRLKSLPLLTSHQPLMNHLQLTQPLTNN